MPDTLSPTTDYQPSAYQQLAYQRLLLAEMGIVPWVRQAQPVQLFDTEAIFDDLINKNSPDHSLQSVQRPQATSPAEISELLHNRPIKNAHPHSSTVIDGTIADVSVGSPLTNVRMPTVSQQSALASFDSQSLKTVAEPIGNILPPIIENIPVIQCHCYAIKIQQWVILADAMLLSQQPQALRLWQNITQNLSAQQYEFRFPLISNTDSHLSDITPLLAQASFAGFLCLIERGSHLDNGEEQRVTKNLHSTPQLIQKIGIVTPFPDYLENEQLRRLPYLTEMLEDYRQKRQFWQVLIANEC